MRKKLFDIFVLSGVGFLSFYLALVFIGIFVSLFFGVAKNGAGA